LDEALSLLVPTVHAQQAPVPPLIRLIVPFPAGGGSDVLARAFAPQLAARLRTNVIVENKVGAASLIGTNAVATGPTDGSMLLFTTNSLLTAVATVRQVSFDIDKDLTPVAMISEGPMVLAVNAKSSFQSPRDLVEAARSKPDSLTYGSSGSGALIHLTTELMNDAANVKTRHIPYKGATPAALDVASGLVDFIIISRSAIIPLVDAGKVRMIGVTSSEPSPAYVGLAPVGTAAPGFGVDLWVMVFARAGTPANLVQMFNREINNVAKSKELRELIDVEGARSVEMTPEQLSARVRKEVATWRQVATSKKIVTD
jgi:tripartite-type tricarboxylate transporter receptor subunit TctC